MFKFIVLVVAIVALQGCVAKPRPDAPQTASTLDVSKAKDVIKDVQNSLNLDPEHIQKVTDTINSNTQTFANKLKEFIQNLKDESKAHEGELDNALKTVQEKLSQTAADLEKTLDPKTVEEANKLRTGLEDSFKKTVEEVEKLHKDYQPTLNEAKTKVDTFTQSLLDQLVETGNNVRATIDKAVADHTKTHTAH